LRKYSVRNDYLLHRQTVFPSQDCNPLATAVAVIFLLFFLMRRSSGKYLGSFTAHQSLHFGSSFRLLAQFIERRLGLLLIFLFKRRRSVLHFLLVLSVGDHIFLCFHLSRLPF